MNIQNDLTIEEYMALNDFPDFSKYDTPTDAQENKHGEYTEQELAEQKRIKNLSPEECEKEYHDIANYIYDVYGEDITAPSPPEFNPNSYDCQCE